MKGRTRPPLQATLVTIAETLALLGGVVVIALALFTAFGISWRAIVGRGIVGDFEIVEILSAWSVFLFFPYAQVVRQHVAVDFVTERLPTSWVGPLARITDLAVALTAAFVGWRVWAGMHDAIEYGEMTMMLRLPMWYVYVPAIFGWCAMAAVSLAQALGLLGEVEKP